MKHAIKIALRFLAFYQMVSTEVEAGVAKDITGGGQLYSRKKTLPLDLTEISKQRADKVICGKSYLISKEGYILFKLTSPASCYLSFKGSTVDKCTTSVYCDGKIQLAPPTNKDCSKEYLVITDGKEGVMTGCGTFTFGNAPLVGRNNETDLTIHYKGSSSGNCIAFCIEDLVDPGKQKLRERKQLKRRKTSS